MKALIHKIYTSPGYTKTLQWGKLITITGSAQVVVQAIGLMCGILIVRLLSTQEYAYYTLANTMLGTITVLADGGVTTGVMAYGGKAYNDRKELGRVLGAGFDLRKRLAIGSLLVAIPILLFLLIHHGANWLTAILIVIALIPAFTTALYGNLLEVIPKLTQYIIPLQKIQVGTACGRLILLSVSLFAFPWTFIALLAAGLPQVWANIQLKRISLIYTDYSRKVDVVIRKGILGIVKRMLPNSIFYCFFGQITIWLLSIFGSTVDVAQIGAIGRITMLINIFYMLTYTLIVPRFARLVDKPRIILNRFIQIQAGLFAISIIILWFIKLFSAEVLWLLGQSYANLYYELLLLMLGTCVSFVAGVTYHLSSSRGWVLSPFINITISIMVVVCGAFIFDISTFKGILLLNICIALSQLASNEVYALYKIIKI